MRFGAFIAPFHEPSDHPTLQLERDFQLVEWLEALDYDEAWFGEHHSGGWEINASPELAIAALASRTSRIRLGTGVVTSPYHHPLMVADRIRQIDHITRGRAIFGVGPGSLPSDAHMMGIDTARVRDMLDESIEPLVRLLRGEVVTSKTDWFTLNEARLQLKSYSARGVEICTASQVSPTGARMAGKFGLGMLSLGATSAGAFNALASNWAIAEQMAQDSGTVVDRSAWRLVAPMHIAETREQARADVKFGFQKWYEYFRNIATLPVAPAGTDPLDDMIASGFVVVGTPDDAIAQIDRLKTQSGGFGTFLFLAMDWADFEQTKRSYELFARYVIPKVNRLNDNRLASQEYLRTNRDRFAAQQKSAVAAKIEQHVAEKGDGNVSPDVISAYKS
ncbi:LLM class flavin-dependent oxidoreductase [Sphingomonas oryzagri]